MDLNLFAEIYSQLEEKALGIMIVYGIGNHDLDGLEVEKYNGETLLNIKTSIFYSGCGTDYDTLTFKLEEMNEDIEYFAEKYNKVQIEKKLVKEKRDKEAKKLKELEEKADYERLKRKFEKNDKSV